MRDVLKYSVLAFIAVAILPIGTAIIWLFDRDQLTVVGACGEAWKLLCDMREL